MRICDRCGIPAKYSVKDIEARCEECSYMLWSAPSDPTGYVEVHFPIDMCESCMDALRDSVKEALAKKR